MHLPQSFFSFPRSFFFVKHPKYQGREFNHGHCLRQNFFLATALKCVESLREIWSSVLLLAQIEWFLLTEKVNEKTRKVF